MLASSGVGLVRRLRDRRREVRRVLRDLGPPLTLTVAATDASRGVVRATAPGGRGRSVVLVSVDFHCDSGRRACRVSPLAFGTRRAFRIR